MNPSTTSSDTHISNRWVTLTDQNNEPEDQSNSNVPFLLHPSYARSKSSLVYDALRNFRISLKWCALDQSSCIGKFASYFAFIFFTIIVPVISSVSIQIPSSAPADDPISFNKLVQVPESGLASIAFFTLFRFFKRYGLLHLLFLDDLQEDSLFVRRGYSRELDKAFRYLACILLPSFFVELAHKIIFFSSVKILLPCNNNSGHVNIPLNSIMFVLVLASWVYRTGVFLLVCVLFRSTCELQILRFEGLHKLFEGHESDPGMIFKEHVRIKKQLSSTSHRYRFFIITCLVSITISQLGALLLVLAFKTDKSFFNSADLVICSAVQLSGFFLCLLGAARITHRAQRIVSIATRWHMTMTSLSARAELQRKLGHDDDEDEDEVNDDGTPLSKSADRDGSISSDIFISIEPSLSFQTRQALVAYLQHNNGGITLFGFALDRGLLHTLFAFEFSLVLWILSKVVVLS